MRLATQKSRPSARRRLLAATAVAAFVLWGCATSSPPPSKPGYPKPYKALGQWYQPLPHSRGFRQRGLASWYGDDFHGKKTSSGEPYNMYAMTAAHKTLPLGTYVRVHNLKNNRQIVVRINDRGPFVRGRIIDLSYAGARKIGIVGPGTAPVEIEALGTPVPATGSAAPHYVAGNYFKGNFTFQVGAFVASENARKLKERLEKYYKNVHITTYDDGRNIFYRVRVGHSATLQEAQAYEAYLIRHGFPDAFTVAE